MDCAQKLATAVSTTRAEALASELAYTGTALPPNPLELGNGEFPIRCLFHDGS